MSNVIDINQARPALFTPELKQKLEQGVTPFTTAEKAPECISQVEQIVCTWIIQKVRVYAERAGTALGKLITGQQP